MGNGRVFDYCYYAELMARDGREVDMSVINRLAMPKEYKEPQPPQFNGPILLKRRPLRVMLPREKKVWPKHEHKKVEEPMDKLPSPPWFVPKITLYRKKRVRPPKVHKVIEMQVENPISISIVQEEPPKPPTPEPVAIPEPIPEESSSSDSNDGIVVEEPRVLTIPLIDWQKAIIFAKYKSQGVDAPFGDSSDETLYYPSLEEMLDDYDKVKEGYKLERHLDKANEEYRPYHYKAHLTFTKLLLELGFPKAFINQITSKYTESSVLETLKLMIRAKRFFRTRPKVFEVFAILDLL
jgi:intein/homing endonuclease